MSSNWSPPSTGADLSAEAALAHLAAIDELLSGDDGGDQDTLAKYLRGSEDLASTLEQHDRQLHDLCNEFIQAHVEQADNICQVYNDFCACDNQLVDFETEIVSFQRKLESNADDIVLMQQQTDYLLRSVNNRKQVSNKINEVYSALQECDSFCDAIANKDVDANYLLSLRELERKLSFLSRNKALQHSAVDNEIRPKLTAAARKAGHKLQRFLSTSIAELTEGGPAALEEKQDALVMNGGFAFSFLQSYNEPVAQEISRLYVRTMSDHYGQQFRTVLQSFAEASAIHAHPLDSIVTAEEVSDILSNRDAGSPAGNQVALPPAKGFPGRTLARRERSVSQHMRTFSDMMMPTKVESLRALRESTFDDTVKSLSSLLVRHGKMQSDQAVAAQLDQCNSWCWQLVKCLQSLVNSCVAECRFIGSFFCGADSSDLGGDSAGDFTDAERMARAVLGKAMEAVEVATQEDLPLVMERTSVLAALRVIELFKQYLCTSRDPIPLLLLSGVLEMSKATLKDNLRTALRNDEAALAYLPTMKLCAFRQAPEKRANEAQLTQDKSYAATLGPNGVVVRVGEVLGQLALLNTAQFQCAALGEAATGVYDPTIATFVHKATQHLLAFVTVLARRHPSVLGQCVFSTINTYCISATWARLAANFKSLSSQLSQGHAKLLSMPEEGGSLQDTTASNSIYMAAEGDVQLLEAQLQREADAWALSSEEFSGGTSSSDGPSATASLFMFVAIAEKALGKQYFVLPEEQRTTPVTTKTLPEPLHESKALSVAASFHTNWQSALKQVPQKASTVIASALKTTKPLPVQHTAASWNQAELVRVMLQSHLRVVLDANTKMAVFVTAFHGSNNEIISKVVNNTAILHAAKELLAKLS